MSPEILIKNSHEKKTDIWSLGVLCYELFMGFCPYSGKNIFEMQ